MIFTTYTGSPFIVMLISVAQACRDSGTCGRNIPPYNPLNPTVLGCIRYRTRANYMAALLVDDLL